MSEIKVQKVNKSELSKHFFILAFGLLIFELVCIYLNFIIDNNVIISLANKYSLTYASVLTGVSIIMLIVTYLILLIYIIINGKGIKFKNEKIGNVNFIYYIFLLLNATFVSILISNILADKTNLEVGLLNPIGFFNSSTTTWVYPIFFIFVFPFFEELIFRGFLLKDLAKYNKHFAIVVTAILGALFHNNVLEFIPALMVGYLLGRIAIKYDSYLLTYVIKLFNNAIFYGLLYIDNSLIIILIIVLSFVIMILLFFSPNRERITRYNKSNIDLYKRFFLNPLVVLLVIVSVIANFLIFYI